MKKVILPTSLIFLINLFLNLSVFAQKPLATFFSSDGYNFTVIMDGKTINPEPRSRVEYIEMDNDWAKVKIVFEDKNIEPIDKTIQGLDADGRISSVTWEIKQTDKGKWKVSPSSWKPIEEAKKEMVQSEPAPAPVAAMEERTQPETTTTVVTTETVTTEGRNPNSSSVAVSAGMNSMSMKIDMNDGSSNSNVDINIGIPGVSLTETESTTTYTTMTTTTTTTSGAYEAAPQSGREIAETNPTPGYNGRTGCSSPMSDDRFASAKSSISSKDFEDTKLTVAKQVMKSNCLQTSQVKEIMKLFDFEDTKLQFAKEAYNYTYDIDNYWELNDVFEFESSIDELNEFINSR